MRFGVLGSLEVSDGERAIEVPAGKQRALLAVLLLNANHAVSVDRLVDALWDEAPPDTAAKAVQVYISQLRKALGRGRVRTKDGGYAVVAEAGELDLLEFEELVERDEYDAALRLWRGQPLAEFGRQRFASNEIARLEELRLTCREKQIDRDLARGRASDIVGELERLVREHPLRERLCGQLMLALYRSGRQADALDVFQTARRDLVEELGIEPGRALRELHKQILNQDPELEVGVDERGSRDAGTTEEPRARELAVMRESRKTVTVVCAALAARGTGGRPLDPEALRRVYGRAHAEIEAALARHGAAVVSVASDLVIGVYGIPAVHEDDARRGLRSAAEFVHAVARTASQLGGGRAIAVEIGVGISTGEVVVGGDLQPMGEPLTAATRLARIASPGDVLFDAQTYRRLRDDVVVQADDDAFRFVDFAAPDAGRSRPFRAPMVGRERELRRLQDAFAQAVGDRSCHLFTVLGSAGVGKSRLLDEFLAQLGEERVCRGRCLPYGEGITYWPVLEAVREAVGIVDADSPGEAAAKLAATLAGEHDATLVAGRVAEVIGLSEAALSAEDGFAAVRTLLEAVARRQPLVVLFDDVHWGEPNFLDLIEHLADWTRDVPLLLVCLARPELLDLRPGWGGGKLNATSILLEPLSDDESGRLVAFLDGQALDSETRRRIVEAAEGNPLFVEEMLSLALEGGGDEALAVPPTIQALLAARLDRLGDAERSVIEAAAVAGKVFYEDAVVELVPEVRGDVAAALGLLVRKELIRPERAGIGGRTYRFRHILIRDAAYESISKSARAELHERFGRWLERMASDRLAEYEEVVGYHVEQACLYVRELGGDETRAHALAAEAAARLGTAGRRAFVRSDAPGGVNLISRAVALLPADDPQRVELVPNVRVVQGLRGDLVWAERVLTEAVEAAAVSGDRRLAANALVQRAFLRLFTGADVTPDELLETARRAIVVFADLDDDLGLARAWRLTAQAHYLARRAEACGDASERALGYARRAEDVFEQREILEWLAIALFLGPLPADEAVQRCEQLLELTRGDLVSEVHILGAQAFLLAMQARVEEAHRLIARGERLMQELGEWIWIYTWHAAAIDLWHGAAEAAEERIRPAYEALKKLGEQSHFSTMAHGLGTALYLQGRYDEAEQLTHECEAAARANDVYSGVIWRSTRAKVLARKGDFEAAERLAAEAVLFAAQGDFHLASAEASMDLATVHEIAGRPRAAADAVEAAMRFYELKGNVLGLDSARARLADLRPVTPDSVPFTPA